MVTATKIKTAVLWEVTQCLHLWGRHRCLWNAGK